MRLNRLGFVRIISLGVILGRGGVLVVSLVAFLTDDPSSIP